jgi:hypothetical protein
MRVSNENLKSKLSPEIRAKLPKKLKDEYSDVVEMLDLYNDDVDIKKYIDTYVSLVNKSLEEKSEKKTETKTVKTATKSVKTETKSQPTAKQVSEVTLEVRFIKRYLGMNGKKKTRKQLLTFINTLQRALTKKQITKSSKYASEIEHIEKELVRIYNDSDVGQSFTFKLDDKDNKVLDRFAKIAASQKQLTSVRLISRFIGIHGKASVKEKAERLLTAIKQALKNKKITSSDPYFKKIRQVEENLKNYISAKQEKLRISDAQLRGLQGIAGMMEYNENISAGDTIALPTGGKGKVKRVSDDIVFLENQPGRGVNKKFVRKIKDNSKLNGVGSCCDNPGIMSSVDVAKMQHNTCGFTGKWLSLIGDPVTPFSMMFWARPGMGKSSLAIELAHYIASKFNRKVLYVSVEEGFNYTTQEKFERLNAVHPNIDIAATLPEDISRYDIIFIDSITRAKMNPDDFVALKMANPTKSFCLIFQATSDGNYRGSKEFEHEVDVSVFINENGYAKTQKSRFGGNGSIKVFSGNVDHIYKFTNLLDAEKFVANRKDEKLKVLNGDDGKFWVTNQDKAKELKAQGYEMF